MNVVRPLSAAVAAIALASCGGAGDPTASAALESKAAAAAAAVPAMRGFIVRLQDSVADPAGAARSLMAG